jgi:crotonobetaine/carnitine-CoA ligase
MTVDHLTGTDATVAAVFAAHCGDVPDKPFCVIQGREHSYREVDAGANRLASAFTALGVAHGDTVAVLMANRVEFFHVMIALQRIGAVYVPFSTLYSADEVQYQLGHCEARVVMVDAAHSALLAEALPGCPKVAHVVVAGPAEGVGPGAVPAGVTVHRLDDLLAGQDGTVLSKSGVRPAGPDDLAMIMYTSGTTSRPKGVMFSAGNLYTAAHTAATHFHWSHEDRFLHYLPLFHSNGGLFGVWPAVVSRATIVMISKFSASQFARQLCEFDITLASINSTHARMIMNHPPSEYDSAHRAWRMSLGLSLRPEEVVAFETRFATRLCPTYGLTESIGNNVIGEPVGPRRIGSAGRVVRGYELRVVRENGTECAPGEPGQAQLRTVLRHGLPMGYWRNPEATERTYSGGWVRSGDIVVVDDGGYVTFVERQSDMIKRSGFNIAPAEVERALTEVNGVAAAAVVPTPDDIRDEAIVAYVVLEPDVTLTADDVLTACAASLASYKVPHVVEIVDALPFTVLGKLDRKELRRRALAYEVRSAPR